MNRTHRGPRRIAGLALITSVALALTACSSGTSSSSPAPSGEASGAITYAFWGSPERADKVNTVIQGFEKKYPKIKVTPNITDYNSYIEKLTVQAAGGTLSCALGTQSTFLSTYASKNTLMPLDDLISSGQIKTSNIPKNVLGAGKIDGKQYMIPTGTFARVVGYNKAELERVGAPMPSTNMTWEKYASWLKAVQKKLPQGEYASEVEGPTMFSLTSWVVGHGKTMFKGNKLGFDKSLLKEWFDYWISLTKAGVTIPASDIQKQTGTVELAPMSIGEAVIGTRDIPQLAVTATALKGAGKPSDIAYVPMPSEKGGRPATILGSNGISIPANCKNPAAAAAFINFFENDKQANLDFQSDNGVLTNTAAQKALLADSTIPESVKQSVTILSSLTKSGELANTTYPDGLTTLTTELTRDYEAAAFGQMSTDAAVDAFFSAAATALQ
jgi:multiple sugar transport system substrate-binding protein